MEINAGVNYRKGYREEPGEGATDRGDRERKDKESSRMGQESLRKWTKCRRGARQRLLALSTAAPKREGPSTTLEPMNADPSC